MLYCSSNPHNTLQNKEKRRGKKLLKNKVPHARFEPPTPCSSVTNKVMLTAKHRGGHWSLNKPHLPHKGSPTELVTIDYVHAQ